MFIDCLSDFTLLKHENYHLTRIQMELLFTRVTQQNTYSFSCSSGQSFLHQLAGAGTYDGDFKLDAEPDPDCDPTQGPCEQWGPGDYTVKFGMYVMIVYTL